MSKIFDGYTNLYPVSKTLKFKLIPMFETEENIEKYGVLKSDELKAKEYIIVKKLFDGCHKKYIEQKLSSMDNLNWSELYDSLICSRKKGTKDFEELAEKFRKSISEHFTSCEEYRNLKPEAIIKSVVKGEISDYNFSCEEQESIKLFNKFSSYFKEYHISRENIYSDKQTSIAYRLINDNFPKFTDNILIFNELATELIEEMEKELGDILDNYHLNEIFNPNFYDNALTQTGIDFYNSLIGGTVQNDTTKIKGLNELLYIKYQKKEIPTKTAFTPLHKQILSEQDGIEALQDKFSSDLELIERMISYGVALNDILEKNTEDLRVLFNSTNLNFEKIYVRRNKLSALSSLLYNGNWKEVYSRISEAGIGKSDYYSLADLKKILKKDILTKVFPTLLAKFEIVKTNYNTISKISNLSKIYDYDIIKTYLESVKECCTIFDIFYIPQSIERDVYFYSVFTPFYDLLKSIVPLYNKVRNYATKKPYSMEKFKLNFENPTLANGWDQNMEYANNTMLFVKDEQYFLGVLNAKNKAKIKESDTDTPDCYYKMVYKLLPGPNKMLPKVFFSNKGLKNFGTNEYILDGYKVGKHLKGENFDIVFCRELIDYFKNCINRHEDWSKFNFKFSDTNTYNDISEFYNEIAKQSYKVSFSCVEETEIRRLVQEGKMFLFQIYNKDFSKSTKGKANLHTLYWKELFTPENLEKPVFKLNGNAELFFRPASIKNPFVHKQGNILILKTDKNNMTVDKNTYISAMSDAKKGMGIEDIRSKYPHLICMVAPYDITKDKRYSKPSYYFNVSVTINYVCEDKSKKINSKVLNDIDRNDDVNIIGIARGERHLVYAVVINQKGQIIEQKSFNEIYAGKKTVNYHQKLDTIEKDRDFERKNWKKISAIKDMKEGYLSAVIKEITDMIIKYNAIVVLEDLDNNFKNSRSSVEKQVYQKFEKMLIDKLNYFTDKNIDKNEKGGIRYGYQLTAKFDSFSKIGRQSGFLFYVPVSYTTAIDPATGFVNLFAPDNLCYHNVEQAKEFIGKFKEISYDNQLDCFKFDFTYSNFNLKRKDYVDSWSVHSYGENRVVHIKEDNTTKLEYIDVTYELKKLFAEYGLSYTEGNFINDMIMIDSKDFWTRFLFLFKTIVQLKYDSKNESYIMSPVRKDGAFFDSRFAAQEEPCNADANGAYHIALKGLRIIKTCIKNGRIATDGAGKQTYNWLEFVQKKEYQK